MIVAIIVVGWLTCARLAYAVLCRAWALMAMAEPDGTDRRFFAGLGLLTGPGALIAGLLVWWSEAAG